MAAERAFFSSSSSLRPSPPPTAPFPAPFVCARTCNRFSFSHDSLDSRARLLIDHFERHGYHHLQIACLALRLSDFCDGDKDGCGGITTAASLLGVLDAAMVSGNTQRRRRRRRRIENGLTPQASDHDAVQESSVFDPDATSSSPIMPSSAHGTELLSSSRNLELANRGEKLHGSDEGESDNRVYDKSFVKEFTLQESTNCGPQSLGGEKAAESERPDAEGRSCHNSSFDTTALAESVSIPVKEPIYEVLEVNAGGTIVTKTISRRQLLKTSGLRLRDIRSVDPSLWVTNSAPALLIRDQAILLKLGSLRAIATRDSVLIFDHKSIGAEAFLELLLQRLNPDSSTGVPTMPFELEVVEAALISRTQRLERRLMEIEPRVLALLEVLPNCLTANVLEELRLSKQALVELGSKAGALRQMLLELLESPQEIRRMTIMGRRCSIKKEDGSIECVEFEDKLLADDEEEEMEMLLENYLQRCESCHGQAERLLDSAKEMEDSIAVNLSSRRLEVSRLELLLQVGTFCSALGALVAGIFGMNLKSYLEGSAIAFWTTTLGIILGGIALFFLMYNYLKQRKIL